VTRFGTCATIQYTVLWYDQADKEKVHDVEDSDTPYDLVRGPGNLLSWVGGFRGSQSSQLRASIGEGRSDKDAAEAVEAIEECSVR
jgi:hypothetical protein